MSVFATATTPELYVLDFPFAIHNGLYSKSITLNIGGAEHAIEQSASTKNIL
jgi:hypothetical protein